jgi:histidinol-phosphatase
MQAAGSRRMSGDRLHDLLQAVTDVARVAGKVALGHFRSRLDVETKGDGSPVTVADRAAEVAAREWIARRFPDDAVLGEEFGAQGDEMRRRWLIDPIDGTKSFVRGVPLWGTLIGVARGDEVLAGAVFCPAVDEIVVAAVGEGCWWNGVRTRVSPVDAIGDATVLTTDDRFRAHPERGARWASLAGEAAIVRTWGDCYGYLLVATARAEVMVDNLMSPWDAAALVPVVREAGGAFTDWTGRVTPFGSGAVATNGRLAAPVRERLGIPSMAGAAPSREQTTG